MKMNMSKWISVMLMLTGTFAFGQTKVAHINTGEILQKMPEIKEVEKQLGEFQASFEKALLTMQQDLKDKNEAYETLQKTPTTPKSVLEVKRKELEDLYANYQQFQASAQEELSAKREELLEPVIKKVKDAIIQVAKEKGFDYVFDATEGGGMIYGDTRYDIMNEVLKRLSITTPVTPPPTPKQ
jgi:outer membrane protein